MKLLPDWTEVLHKAWSIKFMLVVAILSGCESILRTYGAAVLPDGVASAIVGVVAALGILARLLAQGEKPLGGKEPGNE